MSDLKPGDRFVSPVPLPTPFEAELLSILIEECAEVQQRATKMLRFGRDDVQRNQSETNFDRLSMEVADLRLMIKLCARAGLIWALDDAKTTAREAVKLGKVAKYMQHGDPLALLPAAKPEDVHLGLLDDMDHEAKMDTDSEYRKTELRIQALGAALSRRDWNAVEQAYSAIRDKFYSHSLTPAKPEDVRADLIWERREELASLGELLVGLNRASALLLADAILAKFPHIAKPEDKPHD